MITLPHLTFSYRLSGTLVSHLAHFLIFTGTFLCLFVNVIMLDISVPMEHAVVNYVEVRFWRFEKRSRDVVFDHYIFSLMLDLLGQFCLNIFYGILEASC